MDGRAKPRIRVPPPGSPEWAAPRGRYPADQCPVPIPPLDSPEAEAARRAARAEREYWAAHYQQYLRQYPDQWVAVVDGQVVATSPDLMALGEEPSRQGRQRTQVWVQFIADDPHRLMPR